MTTSGTKKYRPLVYQAVNNRNGKFYIGVTSCGILKRKREHFCAAFTEQSSLPFHRALRKYGKEGFTFVTLCEFDSYCEALEKEVELIASLKPAYNLTSGGEGALGYKHTPEVIEAMAKRMIGTVGYWRGKKRPPETIEKFREAQRLSPTRYWLGKKRDAATIEKIRAAKVGIPRNGGTDLMRSTSAENMRKAARARRKPVRCIDDGLEFESSGAASIHYGLNRGAVSKAIGRGTGVSGKTFEFIRGLA